MKIKKIKNIIIFIFEIRKLMINYFYYFKKKFIFDSIFFGVGSLYKYCKTNYIYKLYFSFTKNKINYLIYNRIF